MMMGGNRCPRGEGEPAQPKLVIGRRIRRTAATDFDSHANGTGWCCRWRALLGSSAGRDKSERNQCDEDNDLDENRESTHGELLPILSDLTAPSRPGPDIIAAQPDTSNGPEPKPRAALTSSGSDAMTGSG